MERKATFAVSDITCVLFDFMRHTKLLVVQRTLNIRSSHRNFVLAVCTQRIVDASVLLHDERFIVRR